MSIRIVDRTYVPPEAELTITHRGGRTWWLCTCGVEGGTVSAAENHAEHAHDGPVEVVSYVPVR